MKNDLINHGYTAVLILIQIIDPFLRKNDKNDIATIRMQLLFTYKRKK